MNNPSAPIIREYGQEFEFEWPTHQVLIRFSRLHDSRREGIAGDIDVLSTDSEAGGHLDWERFNLSSRRTRTSLANELEDKHPLGFWQDLLEQACKLTSDLMRRGEPVIRIGRRETLKLAYQVDGLTVQHNPTMIFGDGDSGKSLFSLALGLHIDSGLSFFDHDILQAGQVLYLDYEYDDQAHEERLQGLARGMGFDTTPELLYRRCTYPLADDVRTILRIVKENEINCVIVDSCAAACGGDPQLPEPVLRFFTALRSLETSTILVHHTSKDGKAGPFGSVYWRNYARLLWQVKSERIEGANTLQMSLFNEKNNAGPRLKPLGFNFAFQDGAIEVVKGNPRNSTSYIEKVSLAAQVEEGLKGLSVPSHVNDISQEIGKPATTVRKVLNQFVGKRFVKVGEKWALFLQD